MAMSVIEAAERLGVSHQRVRQLLASGEIAGERLGRVWIVNVQDVARLEQQRRSAGRPLGPRRAWGMLDILSGGAAPWLRASARSQVRVSLRGLVGADSDRWRSALRGRSDVSRCRAHPSALDRLRTLDDVVLVPAGEGAKRGFDLVVMAGPDQVYATPETWPRIARDLAVRTADQLPNLVVHLPREVWPFASREVPDAALAADLLDADEPRAVRAGAQRLNELAARAIR